ncbi:hypothetical protein EVG20_g8939 [Dentipellis fragilis]|uniref:J domain-containing protein n=1 Tax=Dentipellis fragilis TaxID=205917 RepID=A0A4Y9Y203_9AGAM|nr:hypothetical protein EVG20_g8939 [Dentipellis fragilis]
MPSDPPSGSIPITVFTGFLGAGKTSIILSLLPQLPKDYRVVLLKNEFGDVEVDSQLAKQSSLAAVSEILNGCIMLPAAFARGSAFPATLAFQIRELERETNCALTLDAIVTVIDAENFAGYEDTSTTARMQAQYTDVLLINKAEHVSERVLDDVIEHLNTLNDTTPKIRCNGRAGVDPSLIFGMDSRLFLEDTKEEDQLSNTHHDEVETVTVWKGSHAPASSRTGHGHLHSEACQHDAENGANADDSSHAPGEDAPAMEEDLLEEALSLPSKEVVYRIKGFVRLRSGYSIVNWAFGRHDLHGLDGEYPGENGDVIRLTVMGERGEIRPLFRSSGYFYLPIDDDASAGNPSSSSLPSHRKHIAWDSHLTADDILSSDANDRPSRAGSTESAKQKQRRAVIAEILAQTDLYKVLGIDFAPELDKLELRRAYLARSKACHPECVPYLPRGVISFISPMSPAAPFGAWTPFHSSHHFGPSTFLIETLFATELRTDSLFISKFPDNPEATVAFQKVSVAYNVLSTPASKRIYDSHPSSREFANMETGAEVRAEETLRSVVIGVFNDFLDGDFEMVRTLLRAMNDLNPSLRLGEEGISSILTALQSVRERVLTCRVFTQTLLSTFSHLLETQASLSKLSYLSVRPRARLSLRLARITLALPLALDSTMRQHRRARARSRARRRNGERFWADRADSDEDADGPDEDAEAGRVFPRRVLMLIEGLVLVLERMEGVLK